MAERTDVYLTFRSKDREKVAELVELCDDSCEKDGKLELEFYETSELTAPEYFVEGVPFVGYHSDGVSFGPHLLFSDGEQAGELPASSDGEPVLSVPRGHPVEEPVPLRGWFAENYALYLRACGLVDSGCVDQKGS